MTKISNHNASFFTPSGCLSAGVLESLAKGLLEGNDLARANEHLASCELCSDSLEGMRLWLARRSSPKGLPHPNEVHRRPGQTSRGSGTVGFTEHVANMNERLRRQMEIHKQAPSVKKIRLIPVMSAWVAIAASIILIFGIYYIIKLSTDMHQNQLAMKQLMRAKQDEKIMAMLDSINSDHEKTPMAIYAPPRYSEKKNYTAMVLQSSSEIDNAEMVMNDAVSANEMPVPEEKMPEIAGNKSTVLEQAKNEWPVASITAVTDKASLDTNGYLAETATNIPEESRIKEYAAKSATTGAARKQGNKMAKQAEEESSVFTIVEEMPSFPGGDEKLRKFLAENIVYPQQAQENGIQGTVYLSFAVDRKGKIGKIKVLKGIGGGCDEEAVRVIKLMPEWIPGKQNGKKVTVLFNMPVQFKIN